MSTHYRLDAVALDGDVVRRIEEPAASFRTYNSSIQEVLWPILEHMEPEWNAEPFPWFESRGMYDGHDGAIPRAEHCMKPQDVMEDVRWIEREVSKHPRRYPAVWTFLLPAGPGEASIAKGSVEAYYKGRAVRLYGDGKQCWAKETTPGPREGIHHELTTEPVVTVSFEPDGPPVEVRVLRAPLSVEYPDIIAGLKRVCLFASQGGLLVLPHYVH